MSFAFLCARVPGALVGIDFHEYPPAVVTLSREITIDAGRVVQHTQPNLDKFIMKLSIIAPLFFVVICSGPVKADSTITLLCDGNGAPAEILNVDYSKSTVDGMKAKISPTAIVWKTMAGPDGVQHPMPKLKCDIVSGGQCLSHDFSVLTETTIHHVINRLNGEYHYDYSGPDTHGRSGTYHCRVAPAPQF